MFSALNSIGWPIIKSLWWVLPFIEIRLCKLPLLLGHPIIGSFCHILLKMRVHYLLLHRLWLCLNIFANWDMSFCSFLIEVTQAMRALYVGVERAPNNDRLRVFFRLSRNRNVVTFATVLVVFDIFRRVNVLVSFLRLRLNEWVCAYGFWRLLILRLMGEVPSGRLVLKYHTLRLLLHEIIPTVTLINLRVRTEVFLAARALQKYVIWLERMHLHHLLLRLV
jgi:hypothetical protein